MAAIHPISVHVPEKAHQSFKPIRYTAAEVAMMAMFANRMDGNSFAQAIGLWTQGQVEVWLDSLAEQEAPYIPTAVQRFFHLQPCKGGYLWSE